MLNEIDYFLSNWTETVGVRITLWEDYFKGQVIASWSAEILYWDTYWLTLY